MIKSLTGVKFNCIATCHPVLLKVFYNAQEESFTSEKSVQSGPNCSVWSPFAMGYVQNCRPGCKYISSFWALRKTLVPTAHFAVASVGWKPKLALRAYRHRTHILLMFIPVCYYSVTCCALYFTFAIWCFAVFFFSLLIRLHIGVKSTKLLSSLSVCIAVSSSFLWLSQSLSLSISLSLSLSLFLSVSLSVSLLLCNLM